MGRAEPHNLLLKGYPPSVCLRCSPGLFRHGCGAVSCHTSSMAANPHLALTKNSSPTTLANGRRAAQNRGVQRQGLWSPVATGETPAGRSQRNTRAAHGAKSPIVPKRHPQMAQSPRRSRKAAVPTPSRGGGRRPFVYHGTMVRCTGRCRHRPLQGAPHNS